MESLSTYAKRFVAQVAKPDVDFVYGLSPVISIEQKTIANNPRSTVGTMTDIASYLNLLFATIGVAALPAHRRADAEPHGEPDSGGDPGAARGHGDRAARAGVQAVRRRAGLRLDRGAQERLPHPDHRRQTRGHLRRGGARRIEDHGHGRGGGPLRGGPQARKGDQGGDRRHAAGGRRADAGPDRQRREQGRGGALLPRAVQQDAPLRLRRHPARVLHVQQPGERLPHLRRPGRSQAHAPGTAGPRPAAQHPRRLLRAGGVQVQSRHLGRPRDVQPVQGARFLARHAVGEAAGDGAHAILYGLEHGRSCCACRRRRR